MQVISGGRRGYKGTYTPCGVPGKEFFWLFSCDISSKSTKISLLYEKVPSLWPMYPHVADLFIRHCRLWKSEKAMIYHRQVVIKACLHVIKLCCQNPMLVFICSVSLLSIVNFGDSSTISTTTSISVYATTNQNFKFPPKLWFVQGVERVLFGTLLDGKSQIYIKLWLGNLDLEVLAGIQNRDLLLHKYKFGYLIGTHTVQYVHRPRF